VCGVADMVLSFIRFIYSCADLLTKNRLKVDLVNLEKLFSVIRKNRRAYDLSYKLYNFLKPGYITIARRLLPSFALERKIGSLTDIQKQKKIPEIRLTGGVAHVIIDPYKFIYTPESEGGGCINVFSDEKELFLIKVIGSFIRKNSIFIDAGANFGLFSILNSSAIVSGKIFAFEPVPKTLSYLRKNVALNKLSAKIRPQGAALSDKDGTAYITTNKFGGNHITSVRNKNSVRIKTLKLDTFCRDMNISGIDIIKADVEGAELLLLRGGEKTISRDKPVLVLEAQENWMRRFNYTPKELFDFLHSKGYSYKLILKDRLSEGTNYKDIGKDLEKTNNILFINKNN
jgi:FkbM family methyltransferase